MKIHFFLMVGVISWGFYFWKSHPGAMCGRLANLLFNPGGHAALGPFEIALDHMVHGRKEAAVAGFTALLTGPQQDRRALFELARMREEEDEDVAPALALLEAAAAESWSEVDHPIVLLRTAQTCIRGQRYDAARRHSQMVIDKYPHSQSAEAAHFLLSNMAAAAHFRKAGV